MYIHPFYLKAGFTCIEVLILDLAFRVAVQCVGKVSAEFFYIKMSRAHSNLFIRRKRNTDPAMRNILRDKSFRQGHDLRNACLIIRPEYRCSITRNKRTSF